MNLQNNEDPNTLNIGQIGFYASNILRAHEDGVQPFPCFCDKAYQAFKGLTLNRVKEFVDIADIWAEEKGWGRNYFSKRGKFDLEKVDTSQVRVIPIREISYGRQSL